jgi:adenylate cyclase class 2
VLTYKEPVVDEASQSKPEHETTVASTNAVGYIVEQLGYRPWVHVTKECENYRFTVHGRDIVATVVRVPEVDGTFLEVETLAQEADLAKALDAVRAVLAGLGVSADDLTTEKYTDAVRQAKAAG